MRLTVKMLIYHKSKKSKNILNHKLLGGVLGYVCCKNPFGDNI